MTHIVLCRIQEYDETYLASGLAAAFGLLDVASLFQTGEKILIKPNLLSAVGPDRAVTPHPTVFSALIRKLQEFGIDLSFGDSPAVGQPLSAARAAGLLEIAEQFHVPLADFTSATTIRIEKGVHLREAFIANGVLEANGLVNLCKLKTHALTGMTGAVKNLYGIIAGTRKAQLHVQFPDAPSFTRMLADLNRQFLPRLIVMDAIVAMEGNGPMNGKPRSCGWLIIGQDPVAIDTTGAVIMGYDPADLLILRASHQAGLGESDPQAIQISLFDAQTGQIETGKTLADLKEQLVIPDFARPVLSRSIMTLATRLAGPFIKRHFMQRPVIDPVTCIRCGQCVKACPVEPKALLQNTPKAVPTYRYDRCIRCFCCQETCPVGAIAVEPSPLGKILAGKRTKDRS